MAVYVDSMRAPYRGMIMCHMLADTTEELVAMADRIGVNRRWIQHAGTPHEHFDVCLSKRTRAVAAGAIEIDRKQAGKIILKRREQPCP